jgi:SAM-dependent methyltransferase
MSQKEVLQVWNNIWEKNPNFKPINYDHDSISILTRILVNVFPPDHMTFLDVGSGPGSRTIPIIGSREHTQLILLDQSKNALDIAIKYAKQKEVPVNYVQANGFQLPFPDKSISCVFANGVNEHFCDPLRQQFITEMSRVAKEDGTVAIIVPNKWNFFHTTNKIIRESMGTWPFGPQFDFTPHELKQRMKKAGLREIKHHGAGAFTSWIRMLPRNKQIRFYVSPTPIKMINEYLWKLDENTFSLVNRYLGREILVFGKK